MSDDGAVVDFQLNEGDMPVVVVDQRDTPVPKAWVNASVRIPAGWDNRWGYADEAGRYSFPLEGAGPVKLIAGKDGYRNSDEIELDISPDQAVPPQKLVVTKLDTIEGHVLWPDGSGAQGIGVSTYDDRPAGRPSRPGAS